MRILFTFVGGVGHFEPLAPIARVAQARGHGVKFFCGPSLVETVEAAGFRAFAVGDRTVSPPSTLLPLRPIDRAREDRDLRDRFARRAARDRAPRITASIAEWRPDVLVCDETDFGALVAAERVELPYATVLVIAAGSFVRPAVVGAALAELRAEHGLAPDPGLEMLHRYLVLSPFPGSYRDEGFPLPATAHAFRPSNLEVARLPPPSWSTALPGAPTVYFTLGTVFNRESGDLLARGVAALAALPANLIVTVGSDIDPAELGLQPDHVHVLRYIPQASVLPYCDLVVSHAGSGSVMGALAYGLPSLLIPIGADQPLNAQRCRELGVARVLDAMEASPERIRDAAIRLLGDPMVRSNAERIRDEIAALPDVGRAVDLIERLATERRPLYSE
jgi:UDP:flavonoid glycosyltransferase YjiC (YdhE family)